MKNKFYLGLAAFALMVVAACDNGNTDVDVIDSAPEVSFDAPTGTVEGETFSVVINVSDGTEDSNISTLTRLDWAVVSNGTDASGSETISDNAATVTITVPGLTAGDYSMNVTAFDSNDNSTTEVLDFTIAADVPDITGTWTLSGQDNTYFVGDFINDVYWWGLTGGDVAARACQMNDTWTFNSDGSYDYVAGADTWVENWQAGTGDGCQAPVAPFVDGSFTYTFDGTNLVVSGQGAYIGLAKVTNDGQLGQELAADAYPASVSYEALNVTDTTMELRVLFPDAGGTTAYWVFNLVKQ